MKESLLSLSGSLDLDSYEIEDEVAVNGKANTNNQSKPQNGTKRESRNNSIPIDVEEELIEDD